MRTVNSAGVRDISEENLGSGLPCGTFSQDLPEAVPVKFSRHAMNSTDSARPLKKVRLNLGTNSGDSGGTWEENSSCGFTRQPLRTVAPPSVAYFQVNLRSCCNVEPRTENVKTGIRRGVSLLVGVKRNANRITKLERRTARTFSFPVPYHDRIVPFVVYKTPVTTLSPWQ